MDPSDTRLPVTFHLFDRQCEVALPKEGINGCLVINRRMSAPTLQPRIVELALDNMRVLVDLELQSILIPEMLPRTPVIVRIDGEELIQTKAAFRLEPDEDRMHEIVFANLDTQVNLTLQFCFSRELPAKLRMGGPIWMARPAN